MIEIQGLTWERTDDTGRNWYAPIFATVTGKGDWGNTYRLNSVSDFWSAPDTDNLAIGKVYKLQLTSKPYTKRDGSDGVYRDIRQVRPATAEETPVASTPSPGYPSQDEFRRSKDEMRWTEAYHMATRLIGTRDDEEAIDTFLVAWAGWFYNELASTGHDVPTPPQQEPEVAPLPEEPSNDLPF